MRDKRCLLLLIFLASVQSIRAAPITLKGEAGAALSDTAKVPKELWPHVRYFSLMGVPEAERKTFVKALDFHVQSLSKELEMIDPWPVTATVLRINLLDYGIDPKVWDKLADSEPYFKMLSKDVSWNLLSQYLGTKAPIVRADWFLWWTGSQDKRNGAGYYDFLGVKSRDDFDKLVGLDKKVAARRRAEVAAIVAESGVALGNRQVLLYGLVKGTYYVTLDIQKQIEAKDNEQRNALTRLNGDFVHDAEEIYATSVNGLFYTYTCDDEGKQADVVPANVASDDRSPTRDKQVHAFISCVRCHQPGLQPIDDWGRKFYQPPNSLGVKGDYAKLKRLRQLYLSPLQEQMDLDLKRYADAIKRCNGMTPQENAANYALHWERYEESLDVNQAAAELGVDPLLFVPILKAYGSRGGNPLLVQLIPPDPPVGGGPPKPPLKIRRDHFVEVFAEGYTITEEVRR